MKLKAAIRLLKKRWSYFDRWHAAFGRWKIGPTGMGIWLAKRFTGELTPAGKVLEAKWLRNSARLDRLKPS